MDGVEATRRIRRLDPRKGVRIVAMTASIVHSEEVELRAAGMDDFVTKPLTPSRCLPASHAIYRSDMSTNREKSPLIRYQCNFARTRSPA